MGRKTIDLPDGSRYVGEVDEDGVPHGQGILSWPSGVRVEGEWRNGLPNAAKMLEFLHELSQRFESLYAGQLYRYHNAIDKQQADLWDDTDTDPPF